MRIAYLGPPGTFTEEALMASRDTEDDELVPLPTIYDAIVAVQEGRADRALVPIENSLEGSVNATLDALVGEARDVVVVGEVVHAVEHCLLAREEVALGDIGTVISHPQATAQCARFIRSELESARVVSATSTAEAVRMVSSERAPDGRPWAALGTRRAAELYSCAILRAGVEDMAGNQTRFVWLQRGAPDLMAADSGQTAKTSLVFSGVGADTPGWLVRCLSEFAFRGVNLTRIESRPQRQGLGSYMFFVDLEGGIGEKRVADAIAGVQVHAIDVRVLGSYLAA